MHSGFWENESRLTLKVNTLLCAHGAVPSVMPRGLALDGPTTSRATSGGTRPKMGGSGTTQRRKTTYRRWACLKIASWCRILEGRVHKLELEDA